MGVGASPWKGKVGLGARSRCMLWIAKELIENEVYFDWL